MRKITLLLSMLLLSVLAFAQTARTGTVRDEKGEPIPFATVTEVGKNNVVRADANGVFTIRAVEGAQLRITASGHQPQTVAVSGNTVAATLTVTNQQLTEVIVTTALGIQRQKKELGYATARVTNEELTQASPVNVANGLQGKVSGLNVTTINSGVFEDVKITLRGIRSLGGNNNPLLVLDGVLTPLTYLSSINPNDITDVSILKGSSSAAIYGPDARNGVIVVTTRRGTRNDKPVVTLSHTTQLSSISFFPKFQTQFGSGGYGNYIPYENWSWGDAYDGSTREAGRTLQDGSVQTLLYSARPNERKDFFNTGVTNQTDVSFAAKDFYLSVQDARITGIVPDDKNRRTGIRLNTAREYGIFRAGFNVNYIQGNYNIFNDAAMSTYNSANNVGLNDGLLNLIFNTPAHIPITSLKDFKNNPFATYNGYFNDYGVNPYWALDNWRQTGRTDDLLSNLDLSVKATSWLNFTWRGAANIRTNTFEATSKGEVPSDFARLDRSFKTVPGFAQEFSQRSSRLSSEFFATANKTFSDFKVSAIAGHYYRQNDARDNRVSASNLVVPELFTVANRTGELGGSNSVSKSRLYSVYGSVGIGYKGWANIEVTGRNDWTSLLAIGNNSYFYPGVSAALVLSDAVSQIKNSNVVSYLKLRAAWNKTGNADISPYQLDATFGQASGFPYGTLPGYTANNTSYDPQLKPEFTESKEVGFEVGFLRNRINIEAAAYTQDNTNQIIQISVSDATGFTSAFVNAASFVNRGLEFDLRVTPLVKINKFNINFKGNASYNTSEIKSIYPGLERLGISGFTTGGNYAIVGQPAFVFLATDYKRDDQGRVIVSQQTGYPTNDPNVKQFGRTMPTWTIGVNPSISWNGLTFSAVGEYKTGHYAYHTIGADMAWTGVSAATARNNRERFVFPNSVYESPVGSGKYIVNNDVTIANVNDFYTGVYRDVKSNFITSAASWRVREVSLGYDFPVNKILSNQNVIKGVSLTLNARNLFLFLPKSNEYTDPDFNTGGSISGASNNGAISNGGINNGSGINNSQINPPTRVYGANLTITF